MFKYLDSVVVLNMVKQVVAFDIDGTLTRQSVRQTFKSLKQKDGVEVGIVTSNPPLMRSSFVEKHNLEPDFQQSALIKARALLGIGMVYARAEKLYIGNSRTDKIYSTISNWGYIDSTDTVSLAELTKG